VASSGFIFVRAFDVWRFVPEIFLFVFWVVFLIWGLIWLQLVARKIPKDLKTSQNIPKRLEKSL